MALLPLSVKNIVKAFDQTYLNISEETEPVPDFELDQPVSW